MDKKTIKEFTQREERYIREREEREEFQARCDHKFEKKGKIQSTLKQTSGGKLKCEVCGAIVDFEPKGKQEVLDAVDTLMTCLHQVKSIQDVNDDVLRQIGFVGMFLNRMEALYTPTRNQLSARVDGGQARHNNHDDRYDYDYDDFGNYARNNRPVTLSDWERKNHKGKGKGKDHGKDKKGKGKDHGKDKKKKKKDDYRW